MKKLFLLTLLVAILASCSKENSLPSATSAAMKLYEQYANRDGLSVALLGNYLKNGETYNALMIQAQNEQICDSLLSEFSPLAVGSGKEISSIEVTSLQSDLATGNIDGLLAQIADSLNRNLPISEQNYSVTVSKNYEDGVLMGESTAILTGDDVDTTRGEAMDEAAIGDNKVGYVVHVESSQRAVWILFYSNSNEYNAIINNIIN